MARRRFGDPIIDPVAQAPHKRSNFFKVAGFIQKVIGANPHAFLLVRQRGTIGEYDYYWSGIQPFDPLEHINSTAPGQVNIQNHDIGS